MRVTLVRIPVPLYQLVAKSLGYPQTDGFVIECPAYAHTTVTYKVVPDKRARRAKETGE